ncbi:unnamed protein product [marine sediment metagenome]|uniref:Zinc ribbon domain-containing protein n=1 Tax=marine sediment metagenome TaxID=412755 RepID=X0Z9N8_9ZZZZ
MSVRKFPDRYWINIDQAEDNHDFNKQMDALANKLDKGNLYFTSRNLDDTREIKRQARELFQKYYPHLKDEECNLEIRTQPICPKCGELGAFSHEFCSECGAKLLPQGRVLESGEVVDWYNYD